MWASSQMTSTDLRLTMGDVPAREMCESLAHDQGLLDRLADKVAEELITGEFAKHKQAEIENRMEETRLRLVELGSVRAITGIPRNLRDEWPNYGLDRKRAILGAVLNKVTVYPQGSLAPFDADLIDPDWKLWAARVPSSQNVHWSRRGNASRAMAGRPAGGSEPAAAAVCLGVDDTVRVVGGRSAKPPAFHLAGSWPVPVSGRG